MNCWKKPLIRVSIISTLILLISNIVTAQRQFTIADLEKMCTYSTEEMKNFAKKINFTLWDGSDENDDKFFYKTDYTVILLLKSKKRESIHLTLSEEENYFKIKNNLKASGYRYSSTQGDKTIYRKKDYSIAFSINTVNKKRFYIYLKKMSIND